jgi:hypothetical protein
LAELEAQPRRNKRKESAPSPNGWREGTNQIGERDAEVRRIAADADLVVCAMAEERAGRGSAAGVKIRSEAFPETLFESLRKNSYDAVVRGWEDSVTQPPVEIPVVQRRRNHPVLGRAGAKNVREVPRRYDFDVARRLLECLRGTLPEQRSQLSDGLVLVHWGTDKAADRRHGPDGGELLDEPPHWMKVVAGRFDSAGTDGILAER